ncbi:DPP IV N-terminal domain-containing protein [Clostridium pasteurianum]|nr:DPP IV N-terminal domain-containing protein [Clostridium pasteurianum]
MDSRLSLDGKRVALRSFSEDSLFSAEGLSVYDVYTGKKIDFDNKIIVSGDLYRWDSENNLLYYGVEKDEKDYGKIYSYDFQKSKREMVFDKFNGYCTFFAPTDNNSFLYMENDIDLNNMYYYDGKDNKSILITNTMDNIEDYVIDNKNHIVYFIGKETNAENNSLYKFNIEDKTLKRITYDFPKIVDKNGGIAVDNSGKIYFCGLDTDNNSNNIYMYLNQNNSVNLISDKRGIYRVIQNLK